MTPDSEIYKAAKTAVDGRIPFHQATELFRSAMKAVAIDETKRRSLTPLRRKVGNKSQAAKILGIHRNTFDRLPKWSS